MKAVFALVCVLVTWTTAWADTGVLTWSPNPEADIAGYKVYQSTVSGQYGAPVAVLGKVVTHTMTLPNLAVDTRFFFTITAYDVAGNESVKSAEVSKVVAALAYRISVIDAQGVRWGLIGSNPSTIYRNDVLMPGRAKDLRVRLGIAEVLSTDPVTGVSDDRTWCRWSGTNWACSIVDPPPIPKPGTPTVTMVATDATTLSITVPPVDDGTGQPAKLEIRYAVAPLAWGTGISAVCSSSPCVIPGVLPETRYEVLAVAYRGTLNVDAVFGGTSLLATATTPAVLVPDVPPTQPKGLQITKQTDQEIVIVASAKDCPRLLTSTAGSTKTFLQRTVRCTQ